MTPHLTIPANHGCFAEAPRVDERAGIIHGVSVITIGEAKGHDVHIDAKTLNTVVEAARAHKDGVLCKGDHGTGIFEALGTIKNCRIDGDKVRGDLHLFKSHPRAATVIEIARRMPASCGLSISFSYRTETLGKQDFVRVTSLASIDLVDRPAANPTGMFSAKLNRDTTKLMAAYLAAFGQDQYSIVARRSDAFEIMERGIYFSGLSIPGYDFSRAARFGEPKPVWGTRRAEVSAQQEKINGCLSRLK